MLQLLTLPSPLRACSGGPANHLLMQLQQEGLEGVIVACWRELSNPARHHRHRLIHRCLARNLAKEDVLP